MPNHIKVTVLDVGQGSSNFVEIYEDVGAPPVETLVATILVDLGSDSGSKAALASVQYIDQKLRTMAVPTINALFVTHGDSDHHNYLAALTKNFKPVRGAKPTDTRPVLTINSVRYCGARSEYTLKKWRGGKPDDAGNIKNTLTWIERYMPVGSAAGDFPNDDCTFKSWGGTPPAPAPFDTVRGVRLYVLAANLKKVAATSGGKRKRTTDEIVPQAGSYAANTVSLILLLDYQGVQFVVTGDATGLTLHACNGWVKDYVSRDFLPDTKMLTLPHHGALVTGFGLDRPGDASSFAGRARMTEFAGKMGAKSVTASAAKVRSFKHPDIRVVECFMGAMAPNAFWADPRTGAGAGRHFFTAWYDRSCGYTRAPGGTVWPVNNGKASNFFTLETAANVYSNEYYVYAKNNPWLVYPTQRPTAPLQPCTKLTFPPIPPIGQSWQYSVQTGGATTLVPVTNRTQAVPRGANVAVRAAAPAVVGMPIPMPTPVPAAVGAADASARSAARTVRLPGLKVVP